MAKTSSLVLLSEQDFDASTSVPITGTEQKAAGYYSSAGDLQTVAIFTEDFNGTIKVQATLDTTLGTNSFFDVFTFSNDGSSANDSSARFFNSVTNVSGRFTFMRAVVTEFSQGTINKVLLSY